MKKKQQNEKHSIATIFGGILCVVLMMILIVNCTLIIKSYIHKDQVPDIGGYLPMIVLSDSMYPTIESGDLIICHTEDAAEIEVGDIISFFDPAGNGQTVVTHTVTEVLEDDGQLAFRTKGDANNVEDQVLVPGDNLVGVYTKRIPGAGNIALFMQTTTGMIVCVVVPLLLLVGYDILRRRKHEALQQADTQALLEELRKLKEEKENAK